MNSFNVDQAVHYVKTIAEKCRCVSCDKLKGLRVRYPCGHSVCENCVITAEDCLLCLSPPDVSTHIIDGPLSLRVEHASNLLHSFQELFQLDVYRRQRVSEQLQLEKQLFPECIQAPSKYSNSRRSSNISIQNKEILKHSLLPGENTSTPSNLKMENKMSYVQQWLNKSETSLRESKYNLPRKPFTDLNVNGQNVTRPKTQNKVIKKKKAPSKNKIPLKSFNSDFKDKSKLSLKRIKQDCEKDLKCEQIKCDKNESGIFIDDDEIVVIDETQSLDKDKQAWLAVIEADKLSPYDDTTVSKLSKSEIEIVVNTNPVDKTIQCQNVEAMGKVPFYKKSSLYKSINNQFNKNKNENTDKTNNVTITIDSSSFTTTIQFYEEQDYTTDRTKYSIGVQTDDGSNFKSDSNHFSKIVELKVPATENSNCNNNDHIITISDKSKNNHPESADLFGDIATLEANQKHTLPSVKEPKYLIIDDSDSDSEISPNLKDSLIEVTAEVHKSETENDSIVLSQLEQGEYEHRMKHAVRGHTPGSTDSSDKENYDPNRAKRRKLDKKVCSKKH
ncbi:uncharacterized protein LOC123869809 [Maniola jurtina]|uniref:uncharacterized protein LOC123869809 n=1 Tax=Maniola jurtina TaxID=191418 RepID=UPI001E68902E|nr:uncharacterized protein LOC123869809 [Maniola jurtina]